MVPVIDTLNVCENGNVVSLAVYVFFVNAVPSYTFSALADVTVIGLAVIVPNTFEYTVLLV